MPVEAAGRVLKVLSVSFKKLRLGQESQERAANASGSCREGFGGAILHFRNPTNSCGWKAKRARSEQQMPVAGRVLEVLSVSFETLQKGQRAAKASGSRWKLQGGFWRCYPSVSKPYKKVWLEGQESQERAAKASGSRWKLQGRFVLSVSFETLQIAVAKRPREPGASSKCQWSFQNLQKALAGRPREPGVRSLSSKCQWKLQGIGQFQNPTKRSGWKGARSFGAGQAVPQQLRNRTQSSVRSCRSVGARYGLAIEAQETRKLQGRFWQGWGCHPAVSKPDKKQCRPPEKLGFRAGQALPARRRRQQEGLEEGAGRVWSCREGFDRFEGAIQQFRNPTENNAGRPRALGLEQGRPCHCSFESVYKAVWKGGEAWVRWRFPCRYGLGGGWDCKGARLECSARVLQKRGCYSTSWGAARVETAKLHTQGGPRRRPAWARARQGRRIFNLRFLGREVSQVVHIFHNKHL